MFSQEQNAWVILLATVLNLISSKDSALNTRKMYWVYKHQVLSINLIIVSTISILKYSFTNTWYHIHLFAILMSNELTFTGRIFKRYIPNSIVSNSQEMEFGCWCGVENKIDIQSRAGIAQSVERLPGLTLWAVAW